jgi:hypothetical protein
METTNSSAGSKHKLLSQSWELNSSRFSNQISFRWQGKEIRIDIRTTCYPPGRDKLVEFIFSLNGNPSRFEFKYNPYGGQHFGTTPELECDGQRLTFVAGPKFFEIYEQEISVRKEGNSHG